MKILLADDSSTMRLIQLHMLKSFGYEDVVQVDCGSDAISSLEQHPDVKLVLLDWNMPLVNGFECLRAIKANEVTKNIPVIMVTSEANENRHAEAVQSGAADYLVKPFYAEQLKSAIEAAVK